MLSRPQVGSRWEVNMWLDWIRKLFPNLFWINETWELTSFGIVGSLRLPHDEDEGGQGLQNNKDQYVSRKKLTHVITNVGLK
jgi:hypothetical protein